MKQLAFTFSGSNDKAVTVLETKRGRAAKKKQKKNYTATFSFNLLNQREKNDSKRYALITAIKAFFTFGHAHTTLSSRTTEVNLQFLTVSLEFFVCLIPYLSLLWLFYGSKFQSSERKTQNPCYP